MDPVTYYSLTGSVVASALGGIVLTVLILKYGLGPPEDDVYGPLARRRVFMTRMAHAVAAVCFAVTALLALVIFATASPRRADRGLREDIRALDARVRHVEEVLDRVGGAVDELAGRLGASAAPGADVPAARPTRR